MLDKRDKNPNLRIVPEKDRRRKERSLAIDPLYKYLLAESLVDGRPAPGKIFSYEEMSEAVGMDIQSNRYVFKVARKKLEEENRIHLAIIKNIGAKVCIGEDHHDEAKKELMHVNKKSRNALAILDCIRPEDSSPKLNITTTALKTLLHFNIKSTEIRMLKNVEQVCAKTNPKLQVQRTLELFMEEENKKE